MNICYTFLVMLSLHSLEGSGSLLRVGRTLTIILMMNLDAGGLEPSKIPGRLVGRHPKALSGGGRGRESKRGEGLSST